jgi:hypothetical protein
MRGGRQSSENMEKRFFSITGIFKLSYVQPFGKKVLSYPWLEVLLSFEAVKKNFFHKKSGSEFKMCPFETITT